jgi:hypothetical protein
LAASVTLNSAPDHGRTIERHNEETKMSAWLCSHQHIAALVGSYITMLDQYTKVDNPADGAKTLYLENMRSVDKRYEHNAEYVAEVTAHYAAHPVSARMIGKWQHSPLTPGEFFKALDCYEYQACECDDWEQTEAAKLCRDMRKTACRRVPEYDACPWGIDAAPPLKRSAAA